MTDDQFDDELRALVEKHRQKDKTFDWTTAAAAKSYLAQPEPSLDVIQRSMQDLPVVVVPTDEDKAQKRLVDFKKAVAFGVFSEWETCTQQQGIEQLYFIAWEQAARSIPDFEAAAEKVKRQTLRRVLPE